jgi:hypothetical protein
MPRIALPLLLLAAGCATSQAVNLATQPPGAEVSVDGKPAGLTPAVFTDKASDGHYYKIQLTKPGYQPREVTLKQEESHAVVICAGLCPCARVCMLWSSSLPKQSYSWDLVPAQAPSVLGAPSAPPVMLPGVPTVRVPDPSPVPPPPPLSPPPPPPSAR